MEMNDVLIPGLPNDVALNCFIRIPRLFHPLLRSVNSAWRHAFRSNAFYAHRQRLGFVDKSLFIVRELHGNRFEPIVECLELDLTTHKTSNVLASWRRETAKAIFLRGQACVPMHHTVLFVGGRQRCDSSNSFSTNQVHRFCTFTKQMAPGKSMIHGRAQFAWAVTENRLFVAGGRIGEQEWTRKAEMYDWTADEWFPIADMPANVQIHSYFRRGDRLFVGGVHEEAVRVLSYGLNSNEWREEKECVGMKMMMISSRDGVMVNTDDNKLVCAAVNSSLSPFCEDASLSIGKLASKDVTDGRDERWETLEVMEKVNALSVFSMHSLGKKVVMVVPYDLSSMSRWDAFGYPKKDNRPKKKKERKDAVICERCCDDLVQVCVKSCYCYTCSFTSAILTF